MSTHRGRVPVRGIAVIVMVFLVLCVVAPARAQLALYDDFNDPSHLIRADKWNAFVDFRSGVLENLHIIDALLFPTPNPKLIQIDRIRILPGTFGFDVFGYSASPPFNASAIQAAVALLACIPTPGVETSARINLNGFHDATPPDGSLGDIFGVIGVGCPSSGGNPELFWLVVRCNAARCFATSVLAAGVLGPATLGQEHTLRIEKVGLQFRFTADALPPQVVTPPGVVTATANGPFFNTITVVAATTADAQGNLVVIATFDDFMVAP